MKLILNTLRLSFDENTKRYKGYFSYIVSLNESYKSSIILEHDQYINDTTVIEPENNTLSNAIGDDNADLVIRNLMSITKEFFNDTINNKTVVGTVN